MAAARRCSRRARMRAWTLSAAGSAAGPGLRLVLAGGRGWRIAARALGQNGRHGWESERQQKGKTAKRMHRYRDSSTGVRKHTTAGCSASPIKY